MQLIPKRFRETQEGSFWSWLLHGTVRSIRWYPSFYFFGIILTLILALGGVVISAYLAEKFGIFGYIVSIPLVLWGVCLCYIENLDECLKVVIVLERINDKTERELRDIDERASKI